LRTDASGGSWQAHLSCVSSQFNVSGMLKLAQPSCHLPTLKGAGSLPSGKAVRKTHVPKAQNLRTIHNMTHDMLHKHCQNKGKIASCEQDSIIRSQLLFLRRSPRVDLVRVSPIRAPDRAQHGRTNQLPSGVTTGTAIAESDRKEARHLVARRLTVTRDPGSQMRGLHVL